MTPRFPVGCGGCNLTSQTQLKALFWKGKRKKSFKEKVLWGVLCRKGICPAPKQSVVRNHSKRGEEKRDDTRQRKLEKNDIGRKFINGRALCGAYSGELITLKKSSRNFSQKGNLQSKLRRAKRGGGEAEIPPDATSGVGGVPASTNLRGKKECETSRNGVPSGGGGVRVMERPKTVIQHDDRRLLGGHPWGGLKEYIKRSMQ